MTTCEHPFSVSDVTDAILKAIYLDDINKVNEVIDSFVPSYLLPWKIGQSLITEAITSKRLSIAKIMLRRGCHVEDIITYISMYPIVMAFVDAEFLTLALNKDCNSMNKIDYVFHVAIDLRSEPDIVKVFLDCGVNLNLPNSKGLFAANIAARSTSSELLKMLLDAGASIESKTSEGKTNLFFAIQSNSVDNVKLLLERGANCNIKFGERNSSLLHYTVENCFADMTKLLVDAGVELNERNCQGQTPLHIACMFCRGSTTKLLLDAGASINVVDNYGMVPLSILSRRRIALSGLVVFEHSSASFHVIRQLIVLKECGLYINSKNMTFLTTLLKTYYENGALSPSNAIKTIIETCQKEICLMKEIKCNSITCYGILKKLRNRLNVVTQVEIELLQSVLDEKDKFPSFQGIIKGQLKYVKARYNLFNQAQESFSNLIQHSSNKLPYIPFELIKYIVSLLNNYDMSHFIENVKELKITHIQ